MKSQISISFSLFLPDGPPADGETASMKKLALLITLVLAVQLANGQDTVSVTGIGNLKLLSVLWQQQSAEYRALCYQAFNMATCRLGETRIRKRKKYAIIADIDETVLDNSYYEARRILEGAEFDMASWKEWTSEANATAVPGSLEFLTKASERGIEIFYVSNRDTSEVAPTVINLKRLGFPDADRQHMVFRSSTSSKEDRRMAIRKTHEVVMMLGDNLNDFEQTFEKKDNASRNASVDQLKNAWGRIYIVIPNATYGEWESALYKYSRSLSPAEKEIFLKEALEKSPR